MTPIDAKTLKPTEAKPGHYKSIYFKSFPNSGIMPDIVVVIWDRQPQEVEAKKLATRLRDEDGRYGLRVDHLITALETFAPAAPVSLKSNGGGELE